MIETYAWPRPRLGEGIQALAEHASLPLSRSEPPVAPGEHEDIAAWIDTAAAWCGVESVGLDVPQPELDALLRARGPLVISLAVGFLLVLGTRRGAVRVLGPDRRTHRVSRRAVAAAIAGDSGREAEAEVDRLLHSVRVDAPARVRAHLVSDHLNDVVHRRIWGLRARPGAPLAEAARAAHLPRLLAVFVSTFLADYLLFLGSWWLIGRGALQGQIDWGWLVAWALLFATMVPVRMVSTWYEGRVAVAAGGLLKSRLLVGAMRLDPDETRDDGVGRHLSRVLESEAVESLAMSGGLTSAVSAIKLLVIAAVLTAGSGGWLHSSALVLVSIATFLGAWRYYRERREWTKSRFRITHDVLERMIGHRTRLAQLAPEEWHENEDTDLVSYHERSRRADGVYATLTLVKRIWLLVGLAAIAPGFLSGEATLGRLAVALGGTLLGYRAFDGLAEGLSDLVDASVAWGRVSPLFRAAARAPAAGDPSVLGLARRQGRRSGSAEAGEGGSYLDATDLTFRYRTRPQPSIRGASFRLDLGDRVLLTSPSGGGKSTLLSLMNGLRRPDSGTLLVDGIDRQSLGDEAWMKRIATAPQFHENHVFTETLAFNVLMSRRWPPTRDDWREAEALCRELGLDDLLDKMPGGMNQLIGETGWRLSHGERSRVFLARALLQGAPLVLLDESFAALDPDNLARALRCARDRAPSLIVVAHP